MRLSHFFLAIPFLTLTLASHAVGASDNAGVCYKFEDDNVVEKDVCLISFVGGQGEGFWNLKMGEETYNLYEHDESYKKYGQHYFKLDDQPAESYYRNPNHHTISYTNDDNYTYLNCYKSVYDEVCYKENK